MQKNKNSPRAVILTALEVEYMAVRAHLTDLKEEIHKGTNGDFYVKQTNQFNDFP